MRRWPLILLILIVLIVIPVAFVLRARGLARRVEMREAAYQSVLRSYSSVLTPGMSRREVQTHLTQNGKSFGQRSSGGAAYTLVKVGEEEHPWHCSEHNVYVRFVFKPADPSRLMSTDGEDTLTSVDIYKQLEGCM
jgi:hypothetical protein